MIAAAVIWWQPGTAVTVIGFAVLGGALAGIFRPGHRYPNRHRTATGSACHLPAGWCRCRGGAGISALIGLLIGVTSLAILGPALTVLAVLVVGAELILTRLAPVRR